jgi:hypothetical protein
MKHLLSGVAIIAALAFAGPVWAQRTGPGAGAPGPNQPLPGGPGPSSPMSNLPPRVGTQFPATDLPHTAPAPAMAPGMAPGPAATTSAAPPTHRRGRVSTHHKGLAAHPPSAMSGTSAAQLNQEELNRLQAGNFAMPPAPPAPPRGSSR